MITDPKSKALVDNFAAQSLQSARLSTIARDKTVFPQFDQPLRADMRKETEQYFAHVVRTVSSYRVPGFRLHVSRWPSGGVLRDFVPECVGQRVRQVSVAGQHRGGLLTQSSILLVTSNPGRDQSG